MTKRCVDVSKERTVHTYSEMWHCSRVLLMKAKTDKEGSTWQIMAALMFVAFTVEAFLNHLGSRHFECWGEIEKSLSPPKKLSLLCESLEIPLDHGSRPVQTVQKLFRFRNDVAHGKDVTIKHEKQIYATENEVDILTKEFLVPEWQEYCTIKCADRAREDAEALIRELHRKAELADPIFTFGIGFSTISVSPNK